MAQKKKENIATGRTINDLIVVLAGSRNIWVVVVCVIAVFLVSWGIIHTIAEPGSQVSVWGLLQYTKKNSASPEAIILPPLPPAHSPLSSEDLWKLKKEIAHRIVSLRKSDNSIQVLVDDPAWKAQAWTTAQAVVGLLATPRDTVGSYREHIWAAAHYVESVKNPSGGGWQWYRGEGPSVFIPTGWATIAYARLTAYPGVWSSEERLWARTAGSQALTELLRYRDSQSGGFYEVFNSMQSGRARYSYVSVLALLALLEARSASLLPVESMDETISRVIAWLSRQQKLESGHCRFKADERSAHTQEPLGLTMMILYAFELAGRAGYPVETGQCVQAVLEELKDGLRDNSLDAKRDETAYAGINVRIMWFPWTLLWIQEKLLVSDLRSRIELESVRDQLLDQRMLQILVNTFGADGTWRLTETLMALGSPAARS